MGPAADVQMGPSDLVMFMVLLELTMYRTCSRVPLTALAMVLLGLLLGTVSADVATGWPASPLARRSLPTALLSSRQ